MTAPRYEGGHWFYSRNTGLQRQSRRLHARDADGPETVVARSEQLSPDGSIALSVFVPSPDGRHFAYGQSEGGSDWSTYYVRELGTGKQLPDVIRWVKFSGIAWTKDGKGFFYGRYPEPPAGQGARGGASRDKKIYYHALGTPQSADRLIYDRPEEPMLFIDADIDETGRYLFFYTQQGHSTGTSCSSRTSAIRWRRSSTRRCTPLYPGHTAAYKPLGVVNGTLYLLTDRDAPNRKVVAVPIDRPDPTNWKTIVPETKNAIESARLVAGKLAVNALVDVASDVRFYKLDGTAARTDRDARPRDDQRTVRPLRRPEMFYTFTSPLYPATVFRFDVATGKSTPFEPPKLTFDPARYTTERVFVDVEGRHARADVHHAHEGAGEGRHQPDDAVRVRRVRHR